MNFDDKEINEEYILDTKRDLNSTSSRHYLKTKEELEKAEEETEECPYCNRPYINCGLDCIYHIPEPETDDGHNCRCTCEEKAGIIETRKYCSYKKKSIVDDINDYKSIEKYNEE